MSQSESGAAGAKQSIVVEYQLAHPPEKVWRALTDPERLAAWLMPNDFRPVVGHRFQFRAQPQPGWDGVVHCEVLVVEPPSLLRYAWRGGASGQTTLDTVVTWTLEPSGAGTRLKLEHAGFGAKNAFAYENMGKGWRGPIADRLAQTLAAMA
jgi:uncharacterized protein YndB with AHSA1/START domain